MAEIGVTLRGMAGSYFLTGALGEGLTARVFRAAVVPPALPDGTQEVAIKVLRSGLDDTVVGHFYDEALYLNEIKDALQRAEMANGGRQGPAAQPPRCYETFPSSPETHTDGDRFMVLEFMRGQPLEVLLASQGPFSEPDALRLGVQLFRMLHVLHSQVRRTYSDLKFDNLWWEAEGCALRVTDWNVLSQKEDLSGIPSDLRRGAYAMLRILTAERLVAGLPLRRQPGWQSINPGIQQILVRILEPSAAPYDTADAVAEDMNRLLRWWEQDPRRLLDQGRALLEGLRAAQERQRLKKVAFDSEEAKTQTRVTSQFAALLAVLARQSTRGQPWPADLIGKLETLRADAEGVIRTPENLAKQAMALLEAGSGSAAVDVLREGTREFPEDLSLYRHLLLAEAVAGGWRPAKADIAAFQRIIQGANRGQLASVRDALRKLEPYRAAATKQGSASQPVVIKLSLDLEAHERWLSAEELSLPGDSGTEPDWQAAGSAAEAARKCIEQLEASQPAYAAAIETSLTQDIGGRIEELRQQAARVDRHRTAQAEAEKLVEHFLRGAYQQGVTFIAQYRESLLHEEPFAYAALNFCTNLLSERESELAREGFAAGVGITNPYCKLFRLGWRAANLLCQCRFQRVEEVSKPVQNFAQVLGRERANGPEREATWITSLGTNLYKALPEELQSEEVRQTLQYDHAEYVFHRMKKQIDAGYETDKLRATGILADHLGLALDWVATFRTLHDRIAAVETADGVKQDQLQQIAGVLDDHVLVEAVAGRNHLAPRVITTLFSRLQSRAEEINTAAAKAPNGTIGAEQILDRVAVALPEGSIDKAYASQKNWPDKAFNDLYRIVAPQKTIFITAQSDPERCAALAECAGTPTLEEVLARRVSMDEKVFQALMSIVTGQQGRFGTQLDDNGLRLALTRAAGERAYVTATAEKYRLSYDSARLVLEILSRQAEKLADKNTDEQMSYALGEVLQDRHLMRALAKYGRVHEPALQMAYDALLKSGAQLGDNPTDEQMRIFSAGMYGEHALYGAFARNAGISQNQAVVIHGVIKDHSGDFSSADIASKTLIVLGKSLPADISDTVFADRLGLTIECFRYLRGFVARVQKELNCARTEREFQAVIVQACEIDTLLRALNDLLSKQPDALAPYGNAAGWLVERLLDLPERSGGVFRSLMLRPRGLPAIEIVEPWMTAVVEASGILESGPIFRKFLEAKYGPQWEYSTFWQAVAGPSAVRQSYQSPQPPNS